jgi:hypothetical protein
LLDIGAQGTVERYAQIALDVEDHHLTSGSTLEAGVQFPC